MRRALGEKRINSENRFGKNAGSLLTGGIIDTPDMTQIDDKNAKESRNNGVLKKVEKFFDRINKAKTIDEMFSDIWDWSATRDRQNEVDDKLQEFYRRHEKSNRDGYKRWRK